MAKFLMSEHVDAPPAVVFEVASDFRRAAEHIGGIESLEVLTPGPIGVGTRFRETRIMFGKSSTEEMEITAFDSPRHYVVESDSCGSHFRAEYRFVADIAGTHVQLEFCCTPVGLLAKLMSPLSLVMMGPLKKCIGADLADLRRVAEARQQREVASRSETFRTSG